MALPDSVKYLVIGAGIHGLSTAYHLARQLKARGLGGGADILVVDKTAIAAGASGIACGVVRNNYFQPAMRELMAHCVDIWEQHAETLSYHSVGYMQISPECMHEQVGTIYEQQQAIGYNSVFIEGARDCDRYMQALLSDWQAQGITSVLHEKKGGYANNTKSIYGLAALAESEGVRIVTGAEGDRLRARQRCLQRGPRGRHRPGHIRCDQVVVGVGPWVKQIWDMLDLPKTVSIKGRDGRMHDGLQMWTYWSLQEGTLGVDPDVQKTNDGKMPPVIHVDTDAPLYSDVDGSLITDKLWGIYYKPDFHFGGVQGGAMPYKVMTRPDQVAVDPYGPDSPRLHRRRRFRPHVVLGPGPLPEALHGPDRPLPEGAVGRHRLLHARQFPGLRQLPRERLRHRRQQSRLQDDRRRRPGRQGAGRRTSRLLEPFRFSRYAEGRLHPVSNSPFPWS